VYKRQAYALTCPLITKADGGKFGKTEEGNIWLDPKKTSPYKFYQFWLNTGDEDAAGYIKKFTLLSREEIGELILRHAEAPHLRLLQKKLAEDITTRVHSREEVDAAIAASEILFGKGTTETLKRLSDDSLHSVFEGVPQCELPVAGLDEGINLVDFLSDHTHIFASKSEVRRMLKEGGVFLNKEKAAETDLVTRKDLLQDRYTLVQKGKKNYYLVKWI
jgi:tyrosyl-tRNA synthetase